MKFKNYRNKFNCRNRIYSEDDILEMTLNNIFENENDILAQNHQIGIPTQSELEASPNTRWVESFQNDQNQSDGGYWESILEQSPIQPRSLFSQVNKNPIIIDKVNQNSQRINPNEQNTKLLNILDAQQPNNLNTFVDLTKKQQLNQLEQSTINPVDKQENWWNRLFKNNVNSITGGAVDASELNEKEFELYEYKLETPEEKVQYKELEKRKAKYRNDPENIAGFQRGEPMTFEEVLQKGVNPKYETVIENGNLDNETNCHSCVAALEYCRRGYDVNADSSMDNSTVKELGNNAFNAWLDPSTNTPADWITIDVSKDNTFDYLSKNIKQGERYAIGVYPQLEENNPDTANGHIVSIEKGSDGQLKLYDPQTREPVLGDNQVKMYLDSMVDSEEAIKEIHPKLLRLDDKILNPRYYKIFIK